MSEDKIIFQAQLAGIRTTVDGGVNITLSLPEASSDVVKALLDNKGAILNCAIIPERF